MRIIKEGQIPGDKIYNHKCYNCKTEFEFQRKEAKEVDDQRDGNYLNIQCPLCNSLCSINLYPSSGNMLYR